MASSSEFDTCREMFVSMNEHLQKYQQDTTKILQELTTRLEKMELSNQTQGQASKQRSGHHIHSESSFSSNTSINKHVKLELPKFSGEGVRKWVFFAQQFFAYYNISAQDRITIASFAITGDASEWMQWMHLNNQLTNWDDFL